MATHPERPAEGPGFDERLARLEAIVGELENGGIALEPAIERYQEGVALLADCRAILSGFRQRVEELSSGAEPVLRPYEDDPDACAGSGP
jgi:exodeoxyribonuclease VII small subunit